MCIADPSKISDFRENLLHMLLFLGLILFDSYAHSHKNRGCRMCNSLKTDAADQARCFSSQLPMSANTSSKIPSSERSEAGM